MKKCLLKVVQVGMYWASIKGRWSSQKTTNAQRRIYLAVKYGNRWLNFIQKNKFAKSKNINDKTKKNLMILF